jgi:phosphate-selective porin OprO/OprP
MRNSYALFGAALGAALTVALGAGQAQAQDNTITWKGSPQFQNDDAIFKVRGRILLDAIFVDQNRGGGTAGDFDSRNLRGRQMFLGVEGQLNRWLAYKAEGGAVNGGAWAWDDAVIEFKPSDFTSIQVGNVKAFSMENLTSTRFRTFMEQGSVGELTDATYNLGLVARTWGQNWTAELAAQGDSLNNADVNPTLTGPDAKERMQYIARGAFAPILTDDDKVHIGLWARQREHGSETPFTYQTRPNTQIPLRYVSSGAIGGTDTTIGAEFMAIHKNLSVQAEYVDINVNVQGNVSAATASDGHIKSGYIFGSWFPTGDMRNYDVAKGEIGRPKIKNPITAGGYGGVELAVRYDFADLTDIRGTNPTNLLQGKQQTYTLGVNYYPTSYVRVMMNYTHADANNLLDTNDYKSDILQFRTQLDF